MENEKSENRLLTRVLAGILCAFALVGAFVLGFFSRQWTLPKAVREAQNVLEIIEKNYVGDFDEDEFIRSAVQGSLDRYSAYYTPSDYSQVTLHREGVSQGVIGVSFYSDSNVIYSVSGNSPAERAGISDGGKVVGIKLSAEGEYAPVGSYSEFYSVYAQARRGETFYLKIEYGGEVKEFAVAKGNYIESYVWYQDENGSYNCALDGKEWKLVEREKPLKSHINEGFAYIKLSSFNGAAAEQMELALGKMKENGIKKLVLDLRNNGGGYMDILIEIAGRLIPGKAKQVVSSVVYKSGAKYEFSTTANHYDEYGFERISVLGNEGTASASEALIGAILDYDATNNKNIVRVIVSKASDGTFRTYGKGIMQTTFELAGGSAIKLTTAKIYWPTSGVCIHGTGVTPDTDSRVTGVAPVSGTDAELEAAMN